MLSEMRVFKSTLSFSRLVLSLIHSLLISDRFLKRMSRASSILPPSPSYSEPVSGSLSFIVFRQQYLKNSPFMGCWTLFRYSRSSLRICLEAISWVWINTLPTVTIRYSLAIRLVEFQTQSQSWIILRPRLYSSLKCISKIRSSSYTSCQSRKQFLAVSNDVLSSLIMRAAWRRASRVLSWSMACLMKQACSLTTFLLSSRNFSCFSKSSSIINTNRN